VYGPSTIFNSASDRGVINKAIISAVKGENLELFGSGKYIRDYIYITDVIESLIISGFSTNVSGEIFNIGSGKGNSVEEVYKLIARAVEDLAKKKISITYSEWPAESQIIDRRNFVADISKFKDATSWTPRVSIYDGVENFVHEEVIKQSKK
jgi:nucleoside-diphosphate-sugar epimerase